MVFRTKNKEVVNSKGMYDVLKEAKERNTHISNLIPKIEDSNMKQNMREINESVTKIIHTIEKNPDKYSKMNTFFDYYLPKTLTILTKYDEIENQSLTNKESAKFMKQTQDMIEKINKAFKAQLSSLYQADIVDTGAEMKVFDTMLKSDGYAEEDFLKKEGENEE